MEKTAPNPINVADGSAAQPLPLATRALLESIRTQIQAGQTRWKTNRAAEAKIPIERYFSPAIWQAEMKALFRPLPLVAGHSSELAPGQVLAHDSFGMPLLLSRDADGSLRCFLNVCRHRGMRLLESSANAQTRNSVVCPYHGWTYKLSGELRHVMHSDAFDTCSKGARDLVPVPCAERHGLMWVTPDPQGSIDLDSFLSGLNQELPFFGIPNFRHFRTFEAEFPANWKLVPDAFLESYHILALHQNTIAPFFMDGITAAERLGLHNHSLAARKGAQAWATQAGGSMPTSLNELSQLVTASQVIFPNTITIFQLDCLSIVTVAPTGPETLRWTHRMLIPHDKATPDWLSHWNKMSQWLEHGVFRKEDIHCAIGIQSGFKSGANQHITAGRLENGLAWFHDQVDTLVAPLLRESN